MKLIFQIEGSGVGGNETLLHSLFEELARRGDQVALVSPPGSASDYLADAVSSVVDSICDVSLGDFDIGVVVHGKIFETATAFHDAGLPCVWMYGHPYHLSGWSKGELNLISCLTEVVVAQSRYLAASLSGIPTTIATISNGVNLGAFHPLNQGERGEGRERLGYSETDFVLCYPARNVPYKRHAILLDAFARLRQFSPHLKLLLLGYHGELKCSGVQSLIAKPSEMRQLFGCVDLAVFPAKEEGYGCAVAESFALGIPSLIKRSAGHLDFLEAGEEFFYDNSYLLEKKVQELLVNPNLRDRMLKKAITFSKRLDRALVIDRYLEIFKTFERKKHGSNSYSHHTRI